METWNPVPWHSSHHHQEIRSGQAIAYHFKVCLCSLWQNFVTIICVNLLLIQSFLFIKIVSLGCCHHSFLLPAGSPWPARPLLAPLWTPSRISNRRKGIVPNNFNSVKNLSLRKWERGLTHTFVSNIQM